MERIHQKGSICICFILHQIWTAPAALSISLFDLLVDWGDGGAWGDGLAGCSATQESLVILLLSHSGHGPPILPGSAVWVVIGWGDKMLDGRTGWGEKRDAHGDKSKLLFLHHLSPSCSFCKKSNRKCQQPGIFI